MKRIVLAALLLAACATGAPHPEATNARLLGPAPMPDYRLLDVTEAYTAFFDRTADLAESERVAAFNREVAPLFPQFYRAGRPGAPATQERFDARIARSLQRFREERAGYEAAASNFRNAFDDAVAGFQRAFPDANHLGDIYLVHSLGEMDGGLRDIDGVSYLIFGADMIGRYHPPGTEAPFLSHELFHRYHSRWFSECEALWCGVWAEGLAVFAAERLHPGANDEALLLTIPEPARPAVEADRRAAICAIARRLDSTDDHDRAAILSAGDARLTPRLPARFGYYVGYLAAREAARTHALSDLAHLSGPAARRTLEQSLASLVSCN